MEIDYKVFLNREETRVRASKDSILRIVNSEMFARYPWGNFKDKPEGYIEVNFLRDEIVKSDARVKESFVRGDVHSFKIEVYDKENPKRIANNAAELFNLAKPFPEYDS